LTKAGVATLTLSGANTYAGKTTIGNGTVVASSLNKVSGGSASSSLGAPTTVANGTIGLGATTTAGTLSYVGSGETTDRVVDLAGTTGGGVIDQSGTGLLKFSSNMTATGVGIKTLTLQGSTAGTGEIAGKIVDNGGANTTAVTKSGSGKWTLSNANTYTGGTTINSGGTLGIGNASAFGTGAVAFGGNANIENTTGNGSLSIGNAMTLSNGAPTLTGSTDLTWAGAVSITGLAAGSNRTMQVATAGTTFTVNGVISATTTNGITKDGAGTLVLGGSNTASGNFRVSGGTLSVSNIGNTGSSSNLGTSGTFNIGSGASNVTLRYTGTGETSDKVVNLIGTTGTPTIDQSGTGNLKFTSDMTATGNGVKTLTLQGSTAGTGEVSGKIVNSTSATAVAKSGTGTWTLSGANTYTGSTTINGGTLQIGNGGTTGTISTSSAIVDNANFTINRSNAVAQGTDFSGSAITGTGSLTKTGTGTATLNAANAHSGGTTVDNGGLALGDKSAAGTGTLKIGDTTASPSIGISATTNLTGLNAVANPVTITRDFSVAGGSSNLELSGGVSLGAVNRTLTVDSSNSTILSGVIADAGGTGGIRKAGNGVLTLSGPNNYGTVGVTGTTVNAGKLLVNNTTGSGTGSGSVVVSSGATLGGTGSLTGAVTVNGMYSPGASIGTMTTGAMSFGSGSTFTYELNSSLALAVAADLANAAGALTIDPSTLLSISDAGSTKLPYGTKFTLISYSGSWVQPAGHPQPNHFAGLPNGSSFTLGMNQWNIRYDDPNGDSNFGGGSFANHVTITAVPEASMFIVVGLGGIFAFAAVRMGKRMGFNLLKA
jgi:fibronectin-binding autotransporter adhesin